MSAPHYPLVDLLVAEPTWRIDPEVLDTKLVFCFSGSSTGGLFADTLAGATLPGTSWEPECFVGDLFVERVVRDCFQGPQQFVTQRHMLRVLSQPPRDIASTELRREVLRELVEYPQLAVRLREVHEILTRLRAQLEGTSQQDRFDAVRSQLEILATFSQLLAACEAGFSQSRSGLIRLYQFAHEAVASEPFRSLQALLSYDSRVATLDFRVQIGADGRVVDLQLLEVNEAQENPFVNAPLRRWAAKWELLVRGFRFGDHEVMARLVDAVFEGVRPYFVSLVPLLADLEFYLGALHFRARAEAAGLSVCLPEFVEPSESRVMRGLFNPLLLGASLRPVPCTVDTDRQDTILLITGPNSGGKTRLLQSIGLAQLLAQAGVFVPAREARLARSPGLVVSLIQETRADQTEGRLGMELMRIRALFERLPVGAMVILDELCSGTNPSEGEEIFELVVRMLEKLRPQAFVTTHFLEFAARLYAERRIPSLRFLQVDLTNDHAPTYQFVEGVARTSLASQAAARLGVTGDQLLALIEAKLNQAN